MTNVSEAVAIGYSSKIWQRSDEDMQILPEQVRSEVNDTSKHLYCYYRFVVGQKAGRSDEG